VNDREFDRLMMRWLEKNSFRRDLSQDPNRVMADEIKREMRILKVAVPTIRVNPDTGRVEDWGTWTADQDFQGNVNIDGTLDVGGIITADEDLILALQAAAPGATADQVKLYVVDYLGVAVICAIDEGGNITVLSGLNAVFPGDIQAATVYATTDIEAGGDLISGDDVIVGDDLVLGVGQRIVLDGGDSYIYSDVADQIRIYASGTLLMSMYLTGIYFDRNLAIESTGDLRLEERAAGPGATANWVKIYAKELGGVSHLYCRLDDGTEYHLTHA